MDRKVLLKVSVQLGAFPWDCTDLLPKNQHDREKIYCIFGPEVTWCYFNVWSILTAKLKLCSGPSRLHQLFRDYFWQINYSHALFSISNQTWYFVLNISNSSYNANGSEWTNSRIIRISEEQGRGGTMHQGHFSFIVSLLSSGVFLLFLFVLFIPAFVQRGGWAGTLGWGYLSRGSALCVRITMQEGGLWPCLSNYIRPYFHSKERAAAIIGLTLLLINVLLVYCQRVWVKVVNTFASMAKSFKSLVSTAACVSTAETTANVQNFAAWPWTQRRKYWCESHRCILMTHFYYVTTSTCV